MFPRINRSIYFLNASTVRSPQPANNLQPSRPFDVTKEIEKDIDGKEDREREREPARQTEKKRERER